jgi:hypothetical protein
MFFGLTLASVVAYKIMVRPQFNRPSKRLIITGYVSLVFMFSTFTFYPPKMFLFENYFGYVYSGEYGILEDYEPYRVFKKK